MWVWWRADFQSGSGVLKKGILNLFLSISMAYNVISCRQNAENTQILKIHTHPRQESRFSHCDWEPSPNQDTKMFISWPSFGIKRSQSSPLDLNSTRKKTELSNVLLRQSCVEAVFIEGLLIAPSLNSTTALSSRTPRTCLLEKNPRVLVKQ